jgi:hypothetical protein
VVKTHTGKTSSLWPSWLHPRPSRQVSASHDKSTPDWCVGPDARLEHHHRRVRRNESPRHANATTGGHAGGPPRQEP